MGFLEGMSLLILLFIAMPLKHMAGIPLAVTIIGSIHGGLFILYILVLAYVTFAVKWPYKWTAIGFVAAFIPFGNFFYDKGLRNYEKK
jgi:integral membrane protein